MNDLPPPTPIDSAANGSESTSLAFNWWKTAVIALFGLLVLISWMQAKRHLVQPSQTTDVAEEAKRSSAEIRRLVHRFQDDAQELSDEEYRGAALAQEARMKRDRENRVTQVFRNTEDPHARWQRMVDRLTEDVSQFKDFPENSIQWHLREKLERIQEAEPQR